MSAAAAFKAIFIADAHIKGLDDPEQKKLSEFLSSLSLDPPQKLFILGDLFDFWTGIDEVVYYHYFPILAELSKLRNLGMEIIYLEGNHDFSMGGFFEEFLKVKVFPENFLTSLDGKKTLLLHGDTVNMTTGYAIWRRVLRSPLSKILIKIFTPKAAWRVAKMLSKKSRTYSEKYAGIERCLKEFAKEKIKDGCDLVVSGHSHIAVIENMGIENRNGVYANPGGWRGDNTYLVYENKAFRIEKFR